MNDSITWVHLSDFHFRAAEEYDAGIVLAALLKDLAARVEQDGRQPDFAVVSGDLAFSGKAEEYTRVAVFLDRLLATLGLGKDRLLLVPGNHDADRRAVSSIASVVHKSLVDRTDRGAFRQAVADALQDELGRQMLCKRLDGYREFVKSYLGDHLPLEPIYGLAIKRLQVAGREVALLGLNSAWLSYGGSEDQARLILGERQVRVALQAAEGADLRLGVLHHPLDWLCAPDRQDVEPLLLQNCEFLLHGHLHRTVANTLSNPDASALVLAAGACYETREAPNTYHWVRLDLAAGQGRVFFRRYSDEAGGFWTKDVMSYQNVPDGEWPFPLPARLARAAPRVQVKPAAQPVRPEDVQVRQAYIVFSTLAHMPAFLNDPGSLRPPFRLLAQGDPVSLLSEGSEEEQDELLNRFGPPQHARPGETIRELGRFVPGMGRIVAGHEADWALRGATAPISQRGHIPWLIQANWRLALDPAALAIDGWPADVRVRVQPSLALHLYAHGVVAVCLRMAVRCRPGLDWAEFVDLVKTASPFLEEARRQPRAYTLHVGRQTEVLRAGEIAARAVKHLAERLFAGKAEYNIQPREKARLHTFVHVQETEPEYLDPEVHYPLMAGLMLLKPRWDKIDAGEARAYRRLEEDLGYQEGDWIKVNRGRLTLFAADAGRKSQRKYLWRLYAWAELARTQAFLADLSVPKLGRLTADPTLAVSPAWQAFWQDLPNLGELAVQQGYHPDAYPVFAERINLGSSLTAFDRYYHQFLAVDRRPTVASGPERMPETIDLGALAQLLRVAFEAPDLRRFCRDRPLFQAMLDDLQESASLNDTLDTLIEFARKRALLDELLEEVAAYNPRQYERFQDRLRKGVERNAGD